MLSDILYKIGQICLCQYGVSKLVSTRYPTILWTDAILHYEKRSKDDAKRINYLVAALTQLTIAYYYNTHQYQDVFSLMSAYFIWDMFYINFIEPSFYSRPLLFHHIVSLLCVVIGWSYTTPETIGISSHICKLFEASNFWDNITYFLVLQDYVDKSSVIYNTLRVIYLTCFALDRFITFPMLVYNNLIVNNNTFNIYQSYCIGILFVIIMPMSVRLFYYKLKNLIKTNKK